MNRREFIKTSTALPCILLTTGLWHNKTAAASEIQDFYSNINGGQAGSLRVQRTRKNGHTAQARFVFVKEDRAAESTSRLQIVAQKRWLNADVLGYTKESNSSIFNELEGIGEIPSISGGESSWPLMIGMVGARAGAHLGLSIGIKYGSIAGVHGAVIFGAIGGLAGAGAGYWFEAATQRAEKEAEMQPVKASKRSTSRDPAPSSRSHAPNFERVWREPSNERHIERIRRDPDYGARSHYEAERFGRYTA